MTQRTLEERVYALEEAILSLHGSIVKLELKTNEILEELSKDSWIEYFNSGDNVENKNNES